MSKITYINKWIIDYVFSVNISSTSRTQASVSFKCRSRIVCDDSRSSRVTGDQALHQGTKISDSFQRCENHTQDGFISREAGKTMASRLGISRKSKHIELRPLWIQDGLSEGIMSLEKVGTHHNPSDVLTKFAQASALGQHLPKLNLFKDHSLSQVFKFCSSVEKVKT